jgi:hypothetical protein
LIETPFAQRISNDIYAQLRFTKAVPAFMATLQLHLIEQGTVSS